MKIAGRLFLILIFLTRELFGLGPLAEAQSVSARRGPKSVVELRQERARAQALQEALREANLDSLARVYHHYNTADKMREFLLSVMPPKDRAEMEPLLPRGSKVYTVHRTPGAIELKIGQEKAVLRWPKYPRPVLEVDGYEWTISKNQSIKFNFEILKARLEARSARKSALARVLLPEARAMTAAVAAALGAAVGASTTLILQSVGKVIYQTICWAANDRSDLMQAFCNDYLELVKKSRATRKELGAVDPVVQAKKAKNEGKPDEEERWLPGRVEQCPVEKDTVYVADVIQVKVVNGTTIPTTPWYKVRIDLQAGTGKITAGLVAPKETDMESPEREEKAHMILGIDEKGIHEISVRNQDISPTAAPMVPIKLDADEAKLEPWILAEKKKWVDFAERVKGLIGHCLDENTKKKLYKGENEKRAKGEPSAIPQDVEAPKRNEAPESNPEPARTVQ